MPLTLYKLISFAAFARSSPDSTVKSSFPRSSPICISLFESFVEDSKQKTKFIDIITRSVTGKTSAKVFERLNQDKSPDVMLFKPRAIYSLDPEEYSGRAIVLDTDGETVSLLGI